MMKLVHHQGMHIFVGSVLCWFSVFLIGLWTNSALAQSEQPIAYIGHGAFFDHSGNQIPVTQAFVEKAQAWYREDMLTSLDSGKNKQFARFKRQLHKGVKMQGQERLVVQQRTLEWLLAKRYKQEVWK
jgi:hypothetical protein